jgi:hypothetical protein
MADIANLAEVSVDFTLSRALAGSPLVADERRDEILRLAGEPGHVVNTTATIEDNTKASVSSLPSRRAGGLLSSGRLCRYFRDPPGSRPAERR